MCGINYLIYVLTRLKELQMSLSILNQESIYKNKDNNLKNFNNKNTKYNNNNQLYKVMKNININN